MFYLLLVLIVTIDTVAKDIGESWCAVNQFRPSVIISDRHNAVVRCEFFCNTFGPVHNHVHI